MSSTSRGLAIAAVTAFALAWQAGVVVVAIAKPGRIVRVERATIRNSPVIRACQFSRVTQNALIICPDKGDLKVGDVFDVLAEDGSYARAEITAIRPSHLDVCKLGFAVDIEARVFDEVAAPTATGYSRQFAFTGVDITPGVSVLLPANRAIQSPSGKPRENVYIAVDGDGDGQADVLAVAGTDCPGARNKPWVPVGRTLTSFCVDYWRRTGTDWVKDGSEVAHFCQ